MPVSTMDMTTTTTSTTTNAHHDVSDTAPAEPTTTKSPLGVLADTAAASSSSLTATPALPTLSALTAVMPPATVPNVAQPSELLQSEYTQFIDSIAGRQLKGVRASINKPYIETLPT